MLALVVAAVFGATRVIELSSPILPTLKNRSTSADRPVAVADVGGGGDDDDAVINVGFMLFVLVVLGWPLGYLAFCFLISQQCPLGFLNGAFLATLGAANSYYRVSSSYVKNEKASN